MLFTRDINVMTLHNIPIGRVNIIAIKNIIIGILTNVVMKVKDVLAHCDGINSKLDPMHKIDYIKFHLLRSKMVFDEYHDRNGRKSNQMLLWT